MSINISNQWLVRCLSPFFVQNKGIVNEGEVVPLQQSEAKDVIAANRAERITQEDYNAAVKVGRQADFVPKDAEGKPIPHETRTSAQIDAANNRVFLQQQAQQRELLSTRQPKEARA